MPLRRGGKCTAFFCRRRDLSLLYVLLDRKGELIMSNIDSSDNINTGNTDNNTDINNNTYSNDNTNNEERHYSLPITAKILISVPALCISAFIAWVLFFIMSDTGIAAVFSYIAMLIFPSLMLPLIWLRKRKRYVLIWLAVIALYALALGINFAIIKYDESITVDISPSINIQEYLPFEEDSRIVKLDSKTLKLSGELPRIDGAAALFPVYSAFVNAVYPNTTILGDGVFEYNNTPEGYKALALRRTDVFIGVYPSEEQISYAQTCNTTFRYTPIGAEAFVFFVHKDNPIDGLTSDQIRGIYSGRITNWKELGGKDEEIAAYQRNEGSGSQSMLRRFMGDTPIMQAPTDKVNDFMIGIIETVADYRSRPNSIGFSFRYYVEGIVKNPDIKLLAIDGIEPTAENIRNGSYPIVTPFYAVTYEENENENVQKLIDWILSDEGQYIIEETGYVGIVG